MHDVLAEVSNDAVLALIRLVVKIATTYFVWDWVDRFKLKFKQVQYNHASEGTRGYFKL